MQPDSTDFFFTDDSICTRSAQRTRDRRETGLILSRPVTGRDGRRETEVRRGETVHRTKDRGMQDRRDSVLMHLLPLMGQNTKLTIHVVYRNNDRFYVTRVNEWLLRPSSVMWTDV